MAFILDDVVLCGRSYDEYVSMFSLSEQDIEKRVLGAGDGPAAFNARLTKEEEFVVSTDPIYRFTADKIESRVDVSYRKVMEQTRQNEHEFVWDHIHSVEELGRARMEAMAEFLGDFSCPDKGRYVAAELPDLPFRDRVFDIALCSHFLFLYSENFSADFHVRSIHELCRVAEETRIFPVFELGGRISRHLEQVVARLRADGLDARLETTRYEFQKGANQMLKVAAP